MKPTKQRLSAGESLFCGVRWPKSKQPRRAEALHLLQDVVRLDEIESLIRPHFQSDARKTGRPGVSLRMLVRAWVLQKMWTLSDDGLVDVILDSHAAARFIGSDPWQPRPPSASRFRQFRLFMENMGLEYEADNIIAASFEASGIAARPGMIREPVFRKTGRAPDLDTG